MAGEQLTPTLLGWKEVRKNYEKFTKKFVEKSPYYLPNVLQIMLNLQVIGHLGADAKIETSNGKQFVSFNVAHTDKWTGADGVQHESTFWVSCAMNGNGGNVLQYLRKGQCVFVSGRASTRVYSSPKLRQMVAGLNLAVDKIELVGSAPEQTPRELCTQDGQIIRTEKYFQARRDDLTAAGLSLNGGYQLMAADGRLYDVFKSGWLQLHQDAEQVVNNEQAANN